MMGPMDALGQNPLSAMVHRAPFLSPLERPGFNRKVEKDGIVSVAIEVYVSPISKIKP